MRAVVIHAAKDLRIDAVEVGRPGLREVRVKLERGGICGSDLHYYHDGGIGTIVLKQPMTLGHEVAGLIESIGEGVTGLSVGDRVALSTEPAVRPIAGSACRAIRFTACRCASTAARCRSRTARALSRRRSSPSAAQCHVVPKSVTAGEAAMCEPFAVCLHAVNRAGGVFGRRVLVTGCGPIGALAVLAARTGGAAEIVVTDVTDKPFEVATRLGADRCINVATDAAALAAYSRDKGTFDVLLECSGNERALVAAFDVVKPRGIIVQVGMGGAMTLPINVIVAREFELRGTFRFHEEFAVGCRADRQWSCRRQAVDHCHHAVHRRQGRVRARQ